MTLIAPLLSIFDSFAQSFYKSKRFAQRNKNMLCVRPQYASALLRRTLRPSMPYACGAQRALLPVAVGSMNIHNVRDRQTSDVVRRQSDVRRASSLNASYRGGGIINERIRP